MSNKWWRPLSVSTVLLVSPSVFAACSGQTSATTSSSAPVELSITEFAAAADAICIAVFPKVAALADPDGEGGQKPLGLGTVVRVWAEELAALAGPAEIAAAWAEATELLRQSGVKLEESEQLAATGDAAAGDAQSEALWDLQSRASEIILGLEIPFRACSFE